MCYANLDKTSGGYEFTRIPTPSPARYKFSRNRVWSPRAGQAMGQLLRYLRWWELELNPVGGGVIRAVSGADTAYSFQGEGLLFFVANPRPGARLTLRVPESER